MLAANAELERIARLAAALGRDADQLADAVAVERNEWIDVRVAGSESDLRGEIVLG